MNAILALLTAASVLVHNALGCCFHHSHAPSSGCVVRCPLSQSEHSHHFGHGHVHHPEQTDEDHHAPAVPHRHCDEGGCAALAGTSAGSVLKAAYAAFDIVPLLEVRLMVGKLSLHTDYSRLQHDLGPPLRPHLCNLVLLI